MTTYLLDRAKARMKSRARLGALMILPMAAAVLVHAGTVVLPTSGFTCQYNDATTTAAGASCAGIGAVAQFGAGGVSYSISTGGIELEGTPASLLEGTFGTPEPASFGLLGGLAWLGWKYRRRRAASRD